jgi:hypothetical protein
MTIIYITSTRVNGNGVQRRSGETSLEMWLIGVHGRRRAHTDSAP